jgi:hypothetical protein
MNISLSTVKNSERWSNSCTNQSNFAFAAKELAKKMHAGIISAMYAWSHPKQQPKHASFHVYPPKATAWSQSRSMRRMEPKCQSQTASP